MPFIDPDPLAHIGRVVGNGHCVALVRHEDGAFAPHTSRWREGMKVVGALLEPGTAIATFQQGRYGNHTDGRSHAAIFCGHESNGIRVVDQWQGHPAAPRLIANRHGNGPPVDDASRFAVIEPVEDDA